MPLLPPNELLHLGPDPVGASWNHFDLGQGLTTHINYPQSQLGNSPPQGQPWWYSKLNVNNVPVVQFSAPLGGATTSTNTEYARDELREYERDGVTKMAFDPRSDDHWIEGIYRIYGLTGLQKPAVCVQQAHDPGDDTIMVLVYPSGSTPQLILRYNGTKVATLNANYVEGTEFYLKTRVVNGTPEIYYTTNLASIPTTPTHTSSGFFSSAKTGWYFKSGSYNQTNEITDPNVDPDASIIRVEVRELKHWHSKTPAGGAWPTPATYAAAGSPVADAGADAQILPSGTFTRTGSLTLNGATLTSQQWKILSGPLGVGNVLSTAAAVSWNPNTGTTTTGPGSQTRGVGGIAVPTGAIRETQDRFAQDWTITSGGTAGNPKVYDGGNHTVGRITVNADYVVVQNYRINSQNQYAVVVNGNNFTLQNCDIKGLRVSGDGDLNAITLFGSNFKCRYNTAINFVDGDPGGSHTDFIQTWVSSSHPNASSNNQVIGNLVTGPSNPGRDSSIPSIHQIIMVESAGHGGNSGGSGTPTNWLVLDNEFAGSWNQEVKLDCGNNFTFARNNFTGSSDTIFAFICGTGNTVYSSNTFGSGYGSIGASVTSGDGPADPDAGTSTTTTPYPVGTYVLEYSAVTSAGTVSDTVTVTVTNTPAPSGGGVGTYPSLVAVGATATSDGSGTVTVPAPAGVTSGHFQVCIIQDPGTESFTSVPAGWTLLDDENPTNPDFGQPGGDSSTFIFYNTTGDNQSRSWTKSGSRGYHAVRIAWKDWSALGQHLSRSSSYTTSPYASPVTPATAKALVVSVLGSDRSDIGPGPVSVPTGWTQRYSVGPTVNVNEIQWIAVAELQVDNLTPTGGNVPTGTGTATSNFTLTNPDNCAMFSFVLEGVVSTGVTTNGSVSLVAQPRLSLNIPVGGGVLFLTALPNLSVRSIVPAVVRLQASAVFQSVYANVFPRGAFIATVTLTFQVKTQGLATLQLQAIGVLRAGTLPYRRPVLRNEYKYPPPNHPFRLIAQRILDGEIIEWELPVDKDFEYQLQLSGPCVMHGAIRPEQIAVQELGLDGYAYWLHVEINQEIRASAILLPLQYEESAMTFSAEGVTAAPHYAIYDGHYSGIGVDPLSVVRTLWNYVQAQPQSDYGVVLSNISSDVLLGEPAKTIPADPKSVAADTIANRLASGDQIFEDWTWVGAPTVVGQYNDELLAGAAASGLSGNNWMFSQAAQDWLKNYVQSHGPTSPRDVEAKPYELNWWDAKNVGEEIDSLAHQTPFDYVERHQWNASKTDVLHFVDLGYPRIGQPRPNLLFNDENIVEVVPIQESEDNYASAVLVIGAGDGADSIRAYRAEPFADRVRKEVVITDKSITNQQRADARAASELAARRGRTFEISEIVIDAYHSNAPLGSYGVGDDIQVRVEIPWLMEAHTAWYRITSIINKPSSDKLRLGLSKADIFDNTSDIQVITPDNYVPTPPIPPGPVTYQSFITLAANALLVVGAELITATQGAVILSVGKTLTVAPKLTEIASVTLTVGKTLSASGIAAGPSSATVSMTINSALSSTARLTFPSTITLTATPALTANGLPLRPGTVTLTIVPVLGLTPGALTGIASLSATPVLTVNSGSTLTAIANLNTVQVLSVGATVISSGAVSLSVGKTLTIGGAGTTSGAVSMSASPSLSANGTVTGGTTTTQLGKTTDGTGFSTSSANKTVVSKVTATTSGTITAGHARLWIDSGSASPQMVVYADSAGAPGSLLGLSDAITLTGTTEAQRDFTFTGAQQVAITAGTDYWIGFTWPDPGTPIITWSRDTTAGQAQQNSLNAAASFGTPGTALSGPIDAFVDVVSSGSGGGTTVPVVRSVAVGGKTNATDASFPVTKPLNLVAGDYLLCIHVGDADTSSANLSISGFSQLGAQTGGGASNYPSMKVSGKVATSTDVSASTFTVNSDAAGDGAAILIAITAGTYSSTSPVTMGTFTTQARTATMAQTAPSMTGVVNGLLMALFGTDTNNTSEAYPSTPPSGMTFAAQKQGGGLYAMVSAYYQALTSTAATGTKQITPTPSGITTNGWTTAALIVNPASTPTAAGAVNLSISSALTAGATGSGSGFGSTPFGSTPFGS